GDLDDPGAPARPVLRGLLGGFELAVDELDELAAGLRSPDVVGDGLQLAGLRLLVVEDDGGGPGLVELLRDVAVPAGVVADEQGAVQGEQALGAGVLAEFEALGGARALR